MGAKGEDEETKPAAGGGRPRRRRQEDSENSGGAQPKSVGEGWASERKVVAADGAQKEADKLPAGRRAKKKNNFDDEGGEIGSGDIMIIPDLEEEGEAESMEPKVAMAPKNTARRVPSLRELDHAIEYVIPSATDGLDMSLLTNKLVPPEMLHEPDVPWDFDSLLQEVTQEYNAELE